ncbi:MAG: magnesium transporter, partial [Gallionella sp.]|nr:magnesium transporter [Gallionella sp.]
MNEAEIHHTENVQQHLKQVELLLHRHALLETVVHRQEMPREERHALVDTLLHKQHLAALQRKLDGLHPADIAYILEALPIEQRLQVWEL